MIKRQKYENTWKASTTFKRNYKRLARIERRKATEDSEDIRLTPMYY